MGRFTVRLPDSLHTTLEERAQLEGVSLNQFVVYALTQQVTPTYTVQVAPAQAIREERQRYDALLARFGSPDRRAAAEFLSHRDDDQATEDPTNAALVARFRAHFHIGTDASTSSTQPGSHE